MQNVNFLILSSFFFIILHLYGPAVPSVICSSFIVHLNDEVKSFQRYGIYRMLFQSPICGLFDNTGSVRCRIYDTYSLLDLSFPTEVTSEDSHLKLLSGHLLCFVDCVV